MRRKWGAFAWPNGRSRPRGGRRRGRGIRFCIRCAASGSRPASSSTAGSKKLGFWIFMRHKTRKLGGVRLDEREVEAASRRVPRTENLFLYTVRRIWFASCVGFDRGIEKTLGFWCKININEARNNWGAFVWPNGRSRPRAGGCRGRSHDYLYLGLGWGSYNGADTNKIFLKQIFGGLGQQGVRAQSMHRSRYIIICYLAYAFIQSNLQLENSARFRALIKQILSWPHRALYPSHKTTSCPCK